MRFSEPFRPTLVTLAVAAVLAGVSSGADAARIVLTANGSVGATAQPGTEYIPQGLAYPYPPSGFDFYLTDSTLGPPAGGLFFHTYGFTAMPNYFGARVSGDGTFYGRTSASYSDTIVNNSGVAQNLVFNFNVDSGQVELAGTGFGFADLLLNLRFNGASVAREHARVNVDETTGLVTCVDSDMDVGVLSNYMSCAGGPSSTSAFGNAGGYSVGYLLGAGESLTIDYDIVAEVSGQFQVGGGGGQHCGYGYGGHEVVAAFAAVEEGAPPRTSECAFFNALSRSGDPTDASFLPAAFSITAAAVPEPGTLALALVAGSGGLAAARRRRREGR